MYKLNLYRLFNITSLKLTLILLVILSVHIFTEVLKHKVYAKGIGDLSVRSVDTMKFSKDIAREQANKKAFDAVIEQHISQIATLNVTHIALATPFDKEFVPYLRRWVSEVRRHKLKIWFRGNLSGWEGWFEYKKIDPDTRIRLLQEFIAENADLFEDGDIFTSCTECENGALGYPVGDAQIISFRKFMINEYNVIKESFRKINKSVRANYNSMNGDLARHLMNRETTKAMDGVVAIDHYVYSQEKLVNDINFIAQNSGGRIVLGEIGAPIPDIHGSMTQEQQRDWMAEAFAKLDRLESIEGINYWLSYGGSTPLWNPDGSERLAAEVVRNAFGGKKLHAKLVDRNGRVITDADVVTLGETYLVDQNGEFSIPSLFDGQELTINAKGYSEKTTLSINRDSTDKITLDFELPQIKSNQSLLARLFEAILSPFRYMFTLLTSL